MAEKPTPKIAEARQEPGKQVALQRPFLEIMRSEAAAKRFSAFAPSPEIGKAIHTSMILALQNEPKLLKAPPLKLLASCFGLCRLGLEINTPRQHAFLLPFNGRAKNALGVWVDVILPQVVVGYRGFIHLAHLSGKLVGIGGNVAVPGDDFDYEFGTSEFLRHRFGPERVEEKADVVPTFAYMTASFKDGMTFDVMSWASVMRIRNESPGYISALKQGTDSIAFTKNPWSTSSWQMGVKTVIRRKSKTMDLSPALDRATMMDEMGERGEADYGSLLDLDPAEWQIEGITDEPTGDQHQVKTPETKDEGKKTEPKKDTTKPAAKPEAKKDEGGDPRPEPPLEGEVIQPKAEGKTEAEKPKTAETAQGGEQQQAANQQQAEQQPTTNQERAAARETAQTQTKKPPKKSAADAWD